MNTAQQYTAGFNSGYLIARYEPGLLTKIIQAGLTATNNYLEGFFSGSKQYAIEYAQMQEKELETIRDEANRRDLERDR